jgi:hypothetical protein
MAFQVCLKGPMGLVDVCCLLAVQISKAYDATSYQTLLRPFLS